MRVDGSNRQKVNRRCEWGRRKEKDGGGRGDDGRGGEREKGVMRGRR